MWDDIENLKVEDNKSKYLKNPEEGISLIASLVPNRSDNNNDNRRYLNVIRKNFDNQLPRILEEINAPDSYEKISKLKIISEKLVEFEKFNKLRDKTIIGIGGRFSAGKSAFINSLLNNNDKHVLLPEDQNPTTSLATYVISGERDEIIACKKNGTLIDLNEEALDAMTHEFYDKYKIGFSRFISNIIFITSHFPQMLTDRVAILDTPGYNKGDIDTKENLRDETIAINSLRGADYIIWLVDIDNGDITSSDIDFLRKLQLRKPILIVLNKADKKTENDCRAIVEKCKETFNKLDIDVFDVVAYSSKDNQEVLDTNILNNFLSEAASFSQTKIDIDDEIRIILGEIEEMLASQISAAQKEQSIIGEGLHRAEDIMSVQSIANQYIQLANNIKRYKFNQRRYLEHLQEIKDALKAIL